jgi:protein involved in polysaccharide export with SLBB domain
MVRRTRAFLLATALSFLALPSGSALAQAERENLQVLAPGDIVRLTVWRRPEFSGEFSVSADGTLKHPIFQGARVVGLPHEGLKAAIRKVLETYETSPQFVVETLYRITLGGEVRNPNLYTLPRETTIPQAIALAGGPTERARIDRVRLIRNGSATMLDLSRIDTTLFRAPIVSGDQVFVERRNEIFREYVLPSVTLVAALASLFAVLRN